MMYNMEGFTRLDHDGLIKDSLNIIDNKEKMDQPARFIYGAFKDS